MWLLLLLFSFRNHNLNDVGKKKTQRIMHINCDFLSFSMKLILRKLGHAMLFMKICIQEKISEYARGLLFNFLYSDKG